MTAGQQSELPYDYLVWDEGAPYHVTGRYFFGRSGAGEPHSMGPYETRELAVAACLEWDASHPDESPPVDPAELAHDLGVTTDMSDVGKPDA